MAQFTNLTRSSGVSLCLRASNLEKLTPSTKEALIQFKYIYDTVPGCSLVLTIIKIFISNLTDKDIAVLKSENLICGDNEYTIN